MSVVNKGTNTVQVVAALLRDGERFLICQRPANKARALLWEFVGGKVEPGETLLQAALREVGEETGIAPAASGTVPVKTYHIFRWGMKVRRKRIYRR